MRTLTDAIKKAESLRNFRDVNKERFERNQDLVDIVLLADELERLGRVAFGATAVLAEMGEDDHTESW
jgi:CO/xanthine dehydrogenase FAD-binding subunit